MDSLGDAVVGPCQEARLKLLRQAGGVDVEAQMNGVRHLVDVLATRTLGADGRDVDLVRQDLGVGHAATSTTVVAAYPRTGPDMRRSEPKP